MKGNTASPEREALTSAFGKSFRSLNGSSLRTKDSFLSVFLAKEAEDLLANFSEFLKTRGERGNVAQCKNRLNGQIKNLLRLLELFFQTAAGERESLPHLHLQRDLLVFNRLILSAPAVKAVATKTVGSNLREEKTKTAGESPDKKLTTKPSRIKALKDSVVRILKDKGKMRNSEIMGQVPGLSQRSINRCLAELAAEGRLIKDKEGRAVFYSSKQ